jgi:hypothetical protein
MKKSEEILREQYFPNGISDLEWKLYVESNEMVKKFIQILDVSRKDAIDKTIELCKVETKLDVDGQSEDFFELAPYDTYYKGVTVIVDKNSLDKIGEKLKNELGE